MGLNFTVALSNNGVPDDTLSPLINIWEAVPGGAKVATDQPMTLIGAGSGGYVYNLLTADVDKNYFGRAYASTLPVGQQYGHCITTVQGGVSFLKAMEGGKWNVINNQMIFYDEDNVTEIARFNLFDNVTPAVDNVNKRERVIVP